MPFSFSFSQPLSISLIRLPRFIRSPRLSVVCCLSSLLPSLLFSSLFSLLLCLCHSLAQHFPVFSLALSFSVQTPCLHMFSRLVFISFANSLVFLLSFFCCYLSSTPFISTEATLSALVQIAEVGNPSHMRTLIQEEVMDGVMECVALQAESTPVALYAIELLQEFQGEMRFREPQEISSFFSSFCERAYVLCGCVEWNA